MSHYTSKDFLVGAALGGLLGTVTALMTAPKSGRKIRQDICDTYCDITDKAQDVTDSVTKKSKSFANSVGSGASDLSDKAKCMVNGISEWISPQQEEEHDTRDLIVGSIAGVVLGAVAGLLLAPKPGADLRDEIADTYNSVSEKTSDMADRLSRKSKIVAKKIKGNSTDWLAIAQDLFEQITGNVQETGEEVVEKGKELFNNKKLKDVVDWASLGLRFMQHIKKRG